MKDRTFLSGLLSAFAFVAGSLGIALLILIYSGGQGPHGSFNGIRNAYVSLILFASIAFLFALISLFLIKRPFFKGSFYVLLATFIVGFLFYSFVTRQ
jgi:hypothetical protein